MQEEELVQGIDAQRFTSSTYGKIQHIFRKKNISSQLTGH